MRFSIAFCWIVVLLPFVVVGVVDGASAADQPDASQSALDPPDPYAVPDGTPEELSQFIRRIMSTPPPDENAYRSAVRAILEAADKILAGKPNEAQAQLAVEVKTGFIETSAEMDAFAAKLKKAGWTRPVRQVRGAALGLRLEEAVWQPGGDAAEKAAKVIEQIKLYLAEAPLKGADVNLAMSAAGTVEEAGELALAAKAYTEFAKIFAASDNEQIADMSKTMEGVARRLTVVGKEIKVEGTLLGGGKLQWPKYRGRVVLVQFWATWCGPCRQEMLNVADAYRQYHGRGFEVVGISIDESREPVEQFVKQQQIPWAMVFDENGSPTADYYGVMGIPEMFLVGKNGKVVSRKVRGAALQEALAKLLPPSQP